MEKLEAPFGPQGEVLKSSRRFFRSRLSIDHRELEPCGVYDHGWARCILYEPGRIFCKGDQALAAHNGPLSFGKRCRRGISLNHRYR